MARLEEDFTKGSIGAHLVRFSLPFLLANLLQSLYSVADMYIVGMFNDAAALAGVNIGGQITNLVAVLTIGLAQGGTVLVAQYFGAKRMNDVTQTIGTLLTFLMLVSLALTAVMLVASQAMLQLIRTPIESMPEALAYLRICLLGNVFIFGYNALGAIQRGLGDSKRPLMFVAVACVLNVGLDLLLVGGFGMGAAGAAWATIASQAVSMALAMMYLRRNNFVFDFRPSSFRIHWGKVSSIFHIGLPSSAQGVLVNFSFLLMTALVNGFGVYAAAAVGIVGKFNGFAILPAMAMSMSVSTMAAQNIGAGLHARAKTGMMYGMWISLGIGAAMFAFTQLFPKWIIGLFSQDAQVLAHGVDYLRTFSFDYICVPFTFCMGGLITGAGHTTFSLLASLTASVLLRMPAAWLLARTPLGLSGIGLAAPIASVGSSLMCAWFVLTKRWMRDVTGISTASDQLL
ncbi:MAG: MATE family efflux transporter [Oscillospiraceae bacterium]|nr:MATE family efflux transporter [Oscillospiraceae bacterium]